MKTRETTDLYAKVVVLIEDLPADTMNEKANLREVPRGRLGKDDVAVVVPPTGQWKELCDTLLDLFSGNQAYALEWLSTPIRALGYRAPIDVAIHDEGGLENVIDVLGRLEHGVYS